MKAGDWIALVSALVTGGGVVWQLATTISQLKADVRELRTDLGAALSWLGDHERRLGRRGR